MIFLTHIVFNPDMSPQFTAEKEGSLTETIKNKERAELDLSEYAAQIGVMSATETQLNLESESTSREFDAQSSKRDLYDGKFDEGGFEKSKEALEAMIRAKEKLAGIATTKRQLLQDKAVILTRMGDAKSLIALLQGKIAALEASKSYAKQAALQRTSLIQTMRIFGYALLSVGIGIVSAASRSLFQYITGLQALAGGPTALGLLYIWKAIEIDGDNFLALICVSAIGGLGVIQVLKLIDHHIGAPADSHVEDKR